MHRLLQTERRQIPINDNSIININDLCIMFRDYGIPCSSEIIATGIEEGKFPFALSIRKANGHRWNLIFRRKAEEWLQQMTGLEG